MSDFDELRAKLRARGEAEGGAMYDGRPDRWWDDFHVRCANGHVSRVVLKSEALGGDACLACYGPVTLTFPEDVDGPMKDVCAPHFATHGGEPDDIC